MDVHGIEHKIADELIETSHTGNRDSTQGTPMILAWILWKSGIPDEEVDALVNSLPEVVNKKIRLDQERDVMMRVAFLVIT